VLGYNVVDFVKFVPGKTGVLRKLHRVEPKLGGVAVLADVNVRRLIAVGAKKSEAITLNSQHCWHIIISSATK